MNGKDEKRNKKDFEILKKYGARWAVLSALKIDLDKKEILIPKEIIKELGFSRVKIGSGCFSVCDVACSLNNIEGNLIARCASLGDEYISKWLDLLSKSMAGQLSLKEISKIPLLKPIETECEFLRCGCDIDEKINKNILKKEEKKHEK